MLLYGTTVAKRGGQRPPNGRFTLNRQSPQTRSLVAWLPLTGTDALISVPMARDYVCGVIVPSSIATTWPNASVFSGDHGIVPFINGTVGAGLNTYFASNAIPSTWQLVPPFTLFARVWQHPAMGDEGAVICCGSSGPLIRVLGSPGRQVQLLASQVAVVLTGATTLAYSTWYDIAATADGTTANVYVNGINDGTIGNSQTYSSAARFRIGADDNAGTGDVSLWTGNISDVRLYNRVLSPAEILALSDPATRWDLYQTPSNRSTFVIQPKPVVGYAPAIRTSRGGNRPSGPFMLNKQSPQSQGLVSWVPLSIWSGTRDLAPYVGATTPVNAPVATGSGDSSLGSAHKFVASSDQYINLGNPTALQITGNLSVSAWVRPASIPALDSGYMIVAKDKDTGGRAYVLDIDDPSSSGYGANGLGLPTVIVPRFYINGGGASDANGNNIIGSDVPLVVGGWAHIVGVFTTAGTLDMYVNGVSARAQRTGGSTSIPSATANVLIGRREYSGFTNPFDGQIADVRIYNRALSANEVWQLIDPATRWDLYAKPPSTSYAFLGLETIKPSRIAVR